jgi:YidC/Oxa1 family membrane protein insertase
MFLYANIFQPLIDVFEAVLKFFHNSIGVSWGWSIVLLTVVIRALMVPLFVKQMHSMQKLQALQPELKALQQKYKEDKQRQQQEMMKFYKENEVNPFASCLPLALQLPVFISLFYMLRQDLRKNICPGVQQLALAKGVVKHGQTVACSHFASIHVPAAKFLFIGDLTNAAHGVTLVVLILLYVGTQLGSTIFMSSPTMDKTQRQLMMALPLFFVLFIISFPAGVIVYWITTNAWTIGQGYFIRRRIGPVTPAVAGAGGGGAGGSGSPLPARSAGRAEAKPTSTATPSARTESSGNGAGSVGGLAGRLLGRAKGEEATSVASRPRERRGAPPPPPRKKKKRSGRRR